MKKPQVYMGTMAESWGAHKKIKNITFSITDECNLRCTYCYFTHKTHKNIMSFDVAKKAIDDILSESLYDLYDGVIWEFIGGEPTLEMDLIDRISDYILFRMYTLKHKWLYCYRFMIGTNGLLYDTTPVQNYITKHRGNLYVAITIDGSKEKHDLSRIKKDGSGSYDDIVRVLPLWRKQFGGNETKATFSHNDLPYLKDSIVNLWNIGIRSVAANIVFEDVWSEGDADIYREQLYALADYIIENDLWDDCSVRFFSPTVGTSYSSHDMKRNYCGTGNMLAINTAGDYYPCVRFMPSAADFHDFRKLGSITEKINPDRMRPFYVLDVINQSKEECMACDIPGGCVWCTGLNFDYSSVGTIFERQTHICEMHKANVEVNKYLWRQYELKYHTISPFRYNKLTEISQYNKFLYVIGDSNFERFCEYPIDSTIEHTIMNEETLAQVIGFCEENNFVPIFCGFSELPKDYYGYQMISLKDWVTGKSKLNDNYFTQLVMGIEDCKKYGKIPCVDNIIITYCASQTMQLSTVIGRIFSALPGVSINIALIEMDIQANEYIEIYEKELGLLAQLICNCWKNGNYCSINVLTSEMFANTNRYCGAGQNTYTISPEGNIYLCAGFYYSNPERNSIGNLSVGINNKYHKYCNMDNAPLCKDCNVRHCKRCIYGNIMGTGEIHVPTEFQCVRSHIEYEYSRRLVEMLCKLNIQVPFDYNKRLEKTYELDPLFNLRGDDFPKRNLGKMAGCRETI